MVSKGLVFLDKCLAVVLDYGFDSGFDGGLDGGFDSGLDGGFDGGGVAVQTGLGLR